MRPGPPEGSHTSEHHNATKRPFCVGNTCRVTNMNYSEKCHLLKGIPPPPIFSQFSSFGLRIDPCTSSTSLKSRLRPRLLGDTHGFHPWNQGKFEPVGNRPFLSPGYKVLVAKVTINPAVSEIFSPPNFFKSPAFAKQTKLAWICEP